MVKFRGVQAGKSTSSGATLALCCMTLLAALILFRQPLRLAVGEPRSWFCVPQEAIDSAVDVVSQEATDSMEDPAPVPESEIPPGCLRLERVCVDQQWIVLMDPVYTPEGGGRPIPTFQTPGIRFNYPFATTFTGATTDVWIKEISEVPAVRMRASSSAEPSADLQNPQFNSRILPLVILPNWPENFSHTLGNTASFLHAHLMSHNMSWVDRVALIVYTPYGLGMPRFYHTLFAPLAPSHPIQTFADFSDRPCATSDGRAGRNRSRCFREMLLCKGLRELEAANISQAAHFIVKSYEASLPATPVAYSSNNSECNNSLGNFETDTHVNTSSAFVCIRILFMVRSASPSVRAILNLSDLLKECRQWTYTDPVSGLRFGAACASYTSKDMFANIAAVRTADVLVGIHGASMANAFFMRPGGAMLELFNPGWPWQLHREWLDLEKQPALQWWGLTIEDPAASEPGEFEATKLPHPHLYKGSQGDTKRRRDQNLRVPWAGLMHVLQEYARVQAAGGLSAYLERRAAKKEPVHWFAAAGGHLKPGGTCDQGCPF